MEEVRRQYRAIDSALEVRITRFFRESKEGFELPYKVSPLTHMSLLRHYPKKNWSN